MPFRVQLKSFSLLALLLAGISAFAQNSGERHGGDLYAGEFQEIERSVLGKLESWSQSGALAITPDEIAKIKSVVAIHEVISKPHACLKTEKPNGECARPEDERDIVNQPYSKPPVVIIGRLRWDSYADRPVDKEILVLHEMIEVSLTQNSRLIRDRTFEQSYQVKLKNELAWKAFKTTHTDYLKDLRREELNYNQLDLSVINTFLKTMKISSDYKECVKMTGKTQRQREARIKICMPLVESFLNAVQEFVKTELDARNRQIVANMDRIIHAHEAWIKGQVDHPLWQTWAHAQLEKVFAETQTAFQNASKKITSDAVYSVLDKASPYTGDLTENIEFLFNDAFPMIAKIFQDARSAMVDELTATVQRALDETDALLDPPAKP
jgi:hypothetical protein